jgi:hypothetical protein
MDVVCRTSNPVDEGLRVSGHRHRWCSGALPWCPESPGEATYSILALVQACMSFLKDYCPLLAQERYVGYMWSRDVFGHFATKNLTFVQNREKVQGSSDRTTTRSFIVHPSPQSKVYL